MNKLRIAAILLCVTAWSTASYAAALVTVNLQSSESILLGNAVGVVLSGGSAADGNGDIVQLGYFQSCVSLIRTKLKVPHRPVLPIDNGIMIWTRFSCKISPPKLTG